MENSENTIMVGVFIKTAAGTVFERTLELTKAANPAYLRLSKHFFEDAQDKLTDLIGDGGANAAVGLNHDLLVRALPLLINEAISFTETSCNLGYDGTPIPGTCSPESVEDLEEYLQLIRDIESEVGPTEEPEVEWFADLVDRRWSLSEKAGEA